MTNYPSSLDDDTTLLTIYDDLSSIGADASNANKSAILALETTLGINPQGNENSVAQLLGVSLDANGNIKASALTGLGLVTLPIYNSEIAAGAGILESKLALDYATADLYNQILNQNNNINTALSFINDTGVKLEPHIDGSSYNHYTNAILVAASSANFLKNRFNVLRSNDNLYDLLGDINNDLVSHEKSDGTITGTNPPVNYGHVAAGIFINTSNFSFVPQTADDLQQFVEYIDNANIFILGTRIQTLYANGISRSARSSSLTNNVEGQNIVPTTQVITYLLNGSATAPVDNIDTGDDIIQFVPDLSVITDNTFDNKFAAVKVGDIVTVNYTGFSVTHLIKEVKLNVNNTDKQYIIRIDGKNVDDGYFTASIDKPLFNINKYSTLALAQVNSPINALPSLIVCNPRGAQALGLGFNPNQLDSSHYNLNLILYPTGNPNSSFINLASIDVTGNAGTTPGQYTLDSIIETTNNAFRTAGFNYRFIAFQYQGNFGIAMTDPYGGSSFSIVAGVLNTTTGFYNNTLSNTIYPNNVIGVPGFDTNDALGFGPNGSNIASPSFSPTFASSNMAQNFTKIFVPLTRENYYVNGVERERFAIESGQILDGYGDSYWSATIIGKNIVPGIRVEVTYQINQDLSDTGLEVGKTLVVQSSSSVVDSGRFIIKAINFTNCPGPTGITTIIVYDAIHSTGVSPFASANIGTTVSIYFNSDSVGFNLENANDYDIVGIPFKRHFEIYIDQDGYTFSHERGRLSISGSTTTVNGVSLFSSSSLTAINIYKISPKLRGQQYGSSVDKITLQITSYDTTTGLFSGYLCNYDGFSTTNQGPTTIGKKGLITRFYDYTNNDYIDFIFNATDTISNITSAKNIDIQLFPSLSLDAEVMLLGTVQVNDSTKKLSYLKDERQFGNTSENEFTNSALDYIATPTKLLSENGIIRGFDSTIDNGILTLTGGIAIVNGKIINMNNEVVNIPIAEETLVPYSGSTVFTTNSWFVCVNDKGEYEIVADADFDPTMSSGTYDPLSLTQDRLFYVVNPNNIAIPAYIVRSSYLSDLIINQKDLVPVALVSATITLSGTYIISSSTLFDLRRFISNGYSGLTSGLSLGSKANFRTINACNNYFTQLTGFKSFSVNNCDQIANNIYVKDNINLGSITIGFNTNINFLGNGGEFTILDNSVQFGDNLNFDKLTFNFNASSGITISGTNVIFKQCIFNIGNTLGLILTGSNIRFIDCIFNVDTDIGITLNTSNIEIDHCIFNYSFDATGAGGYISGQLCNPTSACIFSTITGASRTNIKISNNIFNFSTINHFSAISFISNAETDYYEKIYITNNKFINIFAEDDKRSVISFATTLITVPTLPQGPRIVDIDISNNICDKNQLILISAPYDVGTGFLNNMLVSINVRIEKNICGAICFLTRQDLTSNVYNSTQILDKEDCITIYKNNCRYIYSGFSSGFINLTGDNSTRGIALINSVATTSSSDMLIIENICSWIQTGVATDSTGADAESARLTIKNNKLNAYYSVFLNDYYDSATPVNIGLLIDFLD